VMTREAKLANPFDTLQHAAKLMNLKTAVKVLRWD
jgi:hypothetical protein